MLISNQHKQNLDLPHHPEKKRLTKTLMKFYFLYQQRKKVSYLYHFAMTNDIKIFLCYVGIIDFTSISLIKNLNSNLVLFNWTSKSVHPSNEIPSWERLSLWGGGEIAKKKKKSVVEDNSPQNVISLFLHAFFKIIFLISLLT